MTGVVTPTLDATFRLRLRTSDGAQIGEVVATLDTGFTEFLLLPTSLIEPLGLTVRRSRLSGWAIGRTR